MRQEMVHGGYLWKRGRIKPRSGPWCWTARMGPLILVAGACQRAKDGYWAAIDGPRKRERNEEVFGTLEAAMTAAIQTGETWLGAVLSANAYRHETAGVDPHPEFAANWEVFKDRVRERRGLEQKMEEEQRADMMANTAPRPAKNDDIEHPAYYGGDTAYEVVKVIEAWGLYGNGFRAQTIQYLARADRKDEPLKDLRKARWWLDREIRRLETGLGPGDSEVTDPPAERDRS